MATVLCIATQKGGSGKSTTAINLACALESAGFRVFVVDTDPQATFTKWHRKRKKTGKNGFEVKPIAVGLLADDIEDLRKSDDLDIVLIDCPGNIENITATAVKLSDAVLSPIRPSTIELDHTVETAKFIKEMRLIYPDLRFYLFVNAAMKAWKISRQMAETTREVLGKLPKTTVLETEIPLTVAIAEFFSTGTSIFEYAPKSSSATAYKKLTKELVECLQQK